MFSKKKQAEKEKPSGEEEKYQFMREQIRPQRKRLFAVFLRKLVLITVLAVVFGLIAGATFMLMQRLIDAGDQTDASETMRQAAIDAETTPAPTMEAGEPPAVQGEFEGDYQAFWRRVAGVGKRCNRSVVKVCRKKSEQGFQRTGEPENAQSGIVFRESKKHFYILVPACPLSDTEAVEAEFFDGETAAAQILGMDYTLKMTVLAVAKKGMAKKTREGIWVVRFCDGRDLEIGSPVIAVGSPNGVMKSVVSGNIVNTGLTGMITDGEVGLYCSDIKYCEEGNGFVVDMQGRLEGIITTSFQEITGKTGCAFIEITQLRTLVNHLAAGNEMVYFGVMGCNYNDQEDSKTDGGLEGVYVTDVLPRSPAYRGKIRVADVITKLDGHKVQSLQDLWECLLKYRPGEKVKVTISRSRHADRNEESLEVVFQPKPP